MNQDKESRSQLPPVDKLEAAEALLKLSGAYVRKDILKSLSKAIMAKSQPENTSPTLTSTMTLQEKKDAIWKLWVPDIKGWRKMMTKHVMNERMYNRFKRYFLRARRMLKEELQEAATKHARASVN